MAIIEREKPVEVLIVRIEQKELLSILADKALTEVAKAHMATGKRLTLLEIITDGYGGFKVFVALREPTAEHRFKRGDKVRIRSEFLGEYPNFEPGQEYEVFGVVSDRVALGGEIGTPSSQLIFQSRVEEV